MLGKAANKSRHLYGHIPRNNILNPPRWVPAIRRNTGVISPAVTAAGGRGVVKESGLGDIDFRKAYEFRTTSEIVRAMFVFKLCSCQPFVKHSLKLMTVGTKVLGGVLFRKLMMRTFAGQFIGGETPDDLRKTVAGLQKGRIGPMLFVPTEEDVGETESV